MDHDGVVLNRIIFRMVPNILISCMNNFCIYIYDTPMMIIRIFMVYTFCFVLYPSDFCLFVFVLFFFKFIYLFVLKCRIHVLYHYGKFLNAGLSLWDGAWNADVSFLFCFILFKINVFICNSPGLKVDIFSII